MKKYFIRRVLIAMLLLGQLTGVVGQEFREPALVSDFYSLRQQSLFWFASDTMAATLREAFIELIDSAWSHGLDSGRYLPAGWRGMDSVPGEEMPVGRWGLRQRDERWSDAALTYLKDLRDGYGIPSLISYDGLTPHGPDRHKDAMLVHRLAEVRTARQLRELTASLVPRSAIYDTLRAALVGVSYHSGKARQLAAALNLYRWISHFNWRQYIVINIAAAELTYFEGDSIRLKMRIVAGAPSKRTPRLAAWCDQVTLYPYWNIPRKIAVNEYLPMFRVSPRLAEAMNIQIFDGNGKVIDPMRINWRRWGKQDFPYSMRQSTGCDNALGVIKFNLTSPYDVYMHDTNFKIAFMRSYRWLSHGCMRLEKPLELGNLLLDGKLDTTFLQSCLKDQQPKTIRIAEPVPVFVIYQTAVTSADGKLRYLRDIYHLMD